MHQILYPLIIVTVLQNYTSPQKPISISEIQHLINHEYAAFTSKEQVMNRSTIVRTLESLVTCTEVGNMLNFRVIEQGSAKRKKYYICEL